VTATLRLKNATWRVGASDPPGNGAGHRRLLVAAMQQIVDWFKKLGMSAYAERFAAKDIDAGVLLELTDQDLKDLGVSFGHRRKMLRAIRISASLRLP